ncbi:MAG: Unknown protein [uncultured Thiotrichaceae bacterium]|uniref:AAA+ ATPase domain-containing protein n=1 Tax=uncultured Thiotrichaceae bacterium TaxID=298394 RepID=A0A6S6S4N8_9GAMM|nr:MAG: Unknown protein [uncultured Thiotrichaceae bacterium]
MTEQNSFNIINQPTDWDEHDKQHLPNLLPQLEKSRSIADARRLDRSAERFKPSQALINAMNAALAARVPLLLTGEPGTGKTQVAWFIRRFLKIKLYEYQVHSNSQASDMRYDFDAVAYLRDAYQTQAGNSEQPPETSGADQRSNDKYLKKRALWQAYEDPNECVLLFDEIDKAPRDFPNDLLQELDQHEFAHPFEDRKVKRTGPPPITIITSNGERRLPDAFLRRCIVHHIELTPELLKKIMQAWSTSFPNLRDEATKEIALERFLQVRELDKLSKQPGAAELILWLTVLSAQNIKVEQISEDVPLAQLPAKECLIKDHNDYKHLEKV